MSTQSGSKAPSGHERAAKPPLPGEAGMGAPIVTDLTEKAGLLRAH